MAARLVAMRKVDAAAMLRTARLVHGRPQVAGRLGKGRVTSAHVTILATATA